MITKHQLLSLIATCSIALSTTVLAHTNDYMSIYKDGTQIHIQQHDTDVTKSKYIVNGKEFGWSDLSPSQQKKLKAIKQKVNELEAKFAIKEQAYQKMEHKLDQAFAQIEKWEEELEKIEDEQESSYFSRKKNKVLERLEKRRVLFERNINSRESQLLKFELEMEKFEHEMDSQFDPLMDEMESLLLKAAKQIQ